MANVPSIYQQPVVAAMAEAAGVDPVGYVSTIQRTVIKGESTAEQVMAFLQVASEYGLNPFLKEIHAFAQGGGIQPIVGVDGWIKKMEEHPERDGETFTFGVDDGDMYCEGTFYRRDRSHPTIIREYLSECQRNTPAWKMKRRMLRNRVICQGARITYSLMPGVMEPDEAEAYIEARAEVIEERRPSRGSATDALKDRLGVSAAAEEGNAESGDEIREGSESPEPAAAADNNQAGSSGASPSSPQPGESAEQIPRKPDFAALDVDKLAIDVRDLFKAHGGMGDSDWADYEAACKGRDQSRLATMASVTWDIVHGQKGGE